MSTRKRLPNGAAEYMQRAHQAIVQARKTLNESRANIKTNPDLHLYMLAEIEIHLADAQRHMINARYNAFEEEPG